MTEIEKSLGKLAEEINAEHQAFRRAFKATYRSALRAGDLLSEAKAQAGHGSWGAWVEENCEFSMRTAQVYMRLANNREEVEELLKNADSAHLSIEGALRSIASQSQTPVVDVLAGEASPYRAYPPDSDSLGVPGDADRKPGVIEQMQASPEGAEAFAQINRDLVEGLARDRVLSRISDLYFLLGKVPAEDVARDVVAREVGEAAENAVLGRAERGGRGNPDIENAVAVHAWLEEYLRVLKDAHAFASSPATRNSYTTNRA